MPSPSPQRVKVNTWTPPTFPGMIITAGVLFGYYAFFTGTLFRDPHSFVCTYIFAGHPAPAAFFAAHHFTFFKLMVAVHVIEAVVMDATRLSVHGVSRGGWRWCAWIMGAVTEGYPAIARFDRLVEEKKKIK